MIELKDIVYEVEEYSRKKRILEIDELFIGEKEKVLLEGKTGAGKSSLLHLIAGLGRPTSGDIRFHGDSIVKLPDLYLNQMRRKTVGILFQSFHLIEELTVRDNLFCALVPEGISGQKLEECIDHALQTVGLLHKKDQLVRTLSGGEKQKCALGRILVMSPSTILLDEPSAHLDIQATEELVELLNGLTDKTFIIVSHDKELKRMLTFDRVIEIHEGKIK